MVASPMVGYGSHNVQPGRYRGEGQTASPTALPGRYWGEGQGPTASPSQASILLARINSRARERKAGVGAGAGEGRPGKEQGREGLEPGTLELRTLVAEEREGIKEGKVTAATPKSPLCSTASLLESVDAVKTRVNGVSTEEPKTAEVEGVKKKKRKKRDSEEVDSSGGLEIVATQEEEVVNESPVTKKKKKKRNRDEELPTGDELLQSGIPEAEMEEGDLIKKKKKKKRHKEDENEVAKIVVGSEENSFIKTKKKKKHDRDAKVNGEILDYPNETQTQREEKRNREEQEEEREKAANKEVEQAQTQPISQQEEDATLPSPSKKKKKNKILDDKIEESSGLDLSVKVPKIEIKEEITETYKDTQMETNIEESPLDSLADGGEKEATQREDDNAKRVKKKKKKKPKKKKDKQKNREVGGFTLLTEVETTRRQKVQRTLPQWLANPTVIGRDLMADGAAVDTLAGLAPPLKDLLKQHKIQQLFPVQRAVIPEILGSAGPLSCRYRPRDVCVSAPTGSGKTLAYVVPLVQALQGRTVPRVRALVLLPVQELATQVYRVFQTYCKGLRLRVGKAVGHSTLQKEQAALVAHHLGRHHSLVDILVATPGRLADHLRMTRGLDLSDLRYLVLDEADRMLAAEGGDWVGQVQRAIADHQAGQADQPWLRPPLQRLLFSATLSSDPEQLQHVTLHHPKLFTVAAAAGGQDKSVAVVMGQYVRPEELREEYVMVEEQVKPLALHHMLVSGAGRQRVLVFTNSVHATHKLALLLAALSEGSARVVAEFSSKKDKRQQILSQFVAGKIDVLVSSDAMARGLDVADIDHVVSYDVTAATTYVHRIGRTARAGRPGTALSIVTKTSLTEFRRAMTGGGEEARQLTLTPEELEPYEQQYIAALASLKTTLEEEERQKRLNRPNGKAKKSKKKLKQRQRKQKRDMRTARLAIKKGGNGKKKVTVNANTLRHHLRP
ncbi:ATP-dependent RNA helicase DDX51 [Chionoecetes opilio]|uniref:ATP-dependent RNA helicase n=1 Tax=Chionoecetes opilio TaxID=41210 RepID=A0A8J4XRR3_CHIOP|nr:ATP-dependent RNA helicase DDX51 [Chionoecetes opilio]